jgi:hypothetical protein
MKRPVLLIIANVAILLAVVGSFALSLLSAPEPRGEPNISLSHPIYDSDLNIDPHTKPSTGTPPTGAPSLSVNVTPGDDTKSFVVTGQTEVGNTVTVNGVPTVVFANGTFSMTLKNCSTNCVVKAINPQGISSEVIKELPQTVSLQTTSQQYVIYGTR